jgi:hypothetical protein
MTMTKMTLEREQWLLGQVRPCPEVFVLAYAGTSYKEWKMVRMCSRLEYWKVEDWESTAKQKYPSATIIRVFMAEGVMVPSAQLK